MARRIIHDGPINTAVKAWMRGQGIHPDDVRGYTLTYDTRDLMTIDIRMFMEDVAPAPKPTNRPFVVDNSGHMWTYDAPRDGYRFTIGGAVRPLDYIRERYGIAEVQPPHATCHNVTSPSDSVPTWVCGAACSKTWPARVRDAEGEEFRRQDDGTYRIVLSTGDLGDNPFTLDDIELYGPITVIEA